MQDEFIPVSDRVSRELDLETLEAPLNVEAVFGNNNPLELEIGIGKGMFISNVAQVQRDSNFLGIEIRRKYLSVALERVEKRSISNVRLILGEGFEFTEKFLAPESLTTIHVYFPDPWPKKRHHKRRLFGSDFIKLVHSRLVPGGKLLIATDHADYYEWITEVLEKQTYLVKCDQLPEPPGNADGLTNYDIKYQKEGRPIHRTGYQKP